MGPGYGESLVLHIGLGEWLIVDSCVDRSGKPAALGYLEEIGVDIGRAVEMVVASHWHADHIGGMAQLVHAVSYTHLTLPTSTLCRSRWSPYH